MRRPRHPGAGGRRDRRGSHVPRLWAGLGRLHPRRICRSPAAHVRFRFQGYRRAVVRQSLHVWRRLRHGRRAAAQGHPARAVRNPPPARRHRRRDRPRGDLAARPARRRPARRARGAAAAGAVPDLLRAHVHEPEGCAVRGGDGDPDAGPRPAGRGVSAAFAADHPDRRTWRRAVDRLADPRRARSGLCAGRFRAAVRGGDPNQRRARSRATLPARTLRADARPDPRLPRDGADLAVVDHGAGQSVPGADLFLALLREAVEGNVRRRAGVGARHALVVSADAVRAAASRSAARSPDRRRRSARWWCCRAATYRRAARPSC